MFMEIEDGHTAKAADYSRRAAPLLGFDAGQVATTASIERWMQEGKLPALAGASWLALQGANDQAIGVLEEMVKERAPFSSYIPWWPFLGSLVKDPRLGALKEAIK